MDSEPRDWEFEKYLCESGVFYSQPHTVHERYHAVWKAAQHRVQWMAFAAGGAGVTLGLFIGWLLWSA